VNNKPHEPVLLREVIENLSPQKGDSYLDLTAGFGGHASAAAKLVGPSGKLTLIDRDSDAISYLNDLSGSDKRVRIIHDDFLSASKSLLRENQKFDCILADVGVSSHHIDENTRGFSFSREGPLDMRMDKRQKISAQDVINNYDTKELEDIFVRYGELTKKQTHLLVEGIKRNRPMTKTIELAEIARSIPHGRRKKIEAQVFQALRIEVNDELGQLGNALPVWAQLLAPKGRIAVISFHSLEDRLVKQFFAQRSKNRYESDLTLLNKKPITAKKNETVYNPRARSARLRAAVKK
jgi:16S rRNA (cytosine1402-N4)-methyltransferase